MKTRRLLSASLIAGLVLTFAPPAEVALSAPTTLAQKRPIGPLDGLSPKVRVPFPIDYLGVSWASGAEPSVRFFAAGRRSSWLTVHEDEVQTPGDKIFSRLISAGDASHFQLRGKNSEVEATAINTTDGPRSPILVTAAANASHMQQPPVISRQQWGADESYRFRDDGSEEWPQAFYATQKLIVHHTATRNDDPDPAATVRAIYRYHAIDRDWGDIGYNFLVDAQGRVYKGRYSGPIGTVSDDTLTGENPSGYGVTAAHVGGWNSGTMGIAALGDFRSVELPAAARRTIVDHLAWEVERHRLDPLGSSTFVNPVSGATKHAANISAHRDWVATECPGGKFYDALPSIRTDVAAKLAQPTDATAPAAPTGLVVTDRATGGTLDLDWDNNAEPDLSGYRVYRSNDQTTWSRIATATSSAHSDAGLTNGTTYYYRVTALDFSGNESSPATGSGVPNDRTAPTKPTGLLAKPGNNWVSLDWADNSPADGVASYSVHRTTDPPGTDPITGTALPRSWNIIATVSDSTYVDGTAANGSTYYYLVTASDTAGNTSPGSEEASATPSQAITVELHVGRLEGIGQSLREGYWRAVLSVTVHDSTHAEVAGAEVSVRWSAGAADVCVTGSAGTCTVTSDQFKKDQVKSIRATVTSVTKSGYAYVSAESHDPDSGSMVISKPN